MNKRLADVRTNKGERIDVSILRRPALLDSKVGLEIQPLAPLSMVNELPGSYYKTLNVPDKKMVCGLLENILGWHIDLSDRKKIFKELHKKRVGKMKKEQEEVGDRGSTYLPLLMDFFDMQEICPLVTKVVFYDDLWKRAYQRKDAVTHPKGTINISYELLKDKGQLKRSDKNVQQVDDKALEEFFMANKGGFPLYYSTPTMREYVFINGTYQIRVVMDTELLRMLQSRLATDNIGYLGNSEGWVDVKIIEV
ncbi:MAG: type I-PGING CRISPR-associated protein Cas5p [Tannerellaceae bacterium]|jgi:CRISPR-associated protein Cas5|nr:type I-PGING CRISPR-associated protein Cas5p [Tannerellaceae bacterium]